eukprot:TRINITY_DN28579_c0_g1_i1.p1 TRINITY_DN28579_c0_g1~~TRINITY_DN28579_c0_g1_i1.p1  ORF type:complete len:1181 (+),score=199.54 TRINITY_DN28579_c0_g1_i1:186-3728(+)
MTDRNDVSRQGTWSSSHDVERGEASAAGAVTPPSSGRLFTRSRLGSMDEASQQEAGKRLEFKDPELELRWRKEGIVANVRQGCKQLLLMDFVWFLWTVYKCVTRKVPYGPGNQQLGNQIDAIACVVHGGICIRCIRHPKVFEYFVCIVTWLVWGAFHGLPPWGDSCEQLAADLAEEASEQRWSDKFLEASNLDCSLQGHTMVHIIMAQLLLTPRLVPSASMMYLNVVLVLMYSLATMLAYFDVMRGFKKYGISYGIPDIMNTVVLLGVVVVIAINKKYFIEKGQRTKFQYDLKRHEASMKIFHILQYMVPVHVISDMVQGKVIAKRVKTVSVLFVMIVDFDQHVARTSSPEDLMEFLNRQFKLMDSICSMCSVTKIETVAEEYVCAVGVLPEDQDGTEDKTSQEQRDAHKKVLLRLIKAASQILQLQSNEVQFKMGMHTGPVVAGVIGQKLPRFRLFGDTVNTAARMMQKGVPGYLQFGEETMQHLPRGVKVEPRGQIEMKGKGQVSTFLFKKAPRMTVSFDPVPSSTGESGGSGGAASSSSQTASLRRSILKGAPPAELRPTTQLLEGDAAAEQGEKGEQGDHGDQGGQSPQSPQSPPLVRRSEVRRSTLRGSMADRMFMAPGKGSAMRVSHDDDMPPISFFPKDRQSKAHEEEFQRVLRKLASQGLKLSHVGSWKWWFSFGLRSPEFTSEVEEKWQRWFHETCICKKLEQRLDKQAVALAVLTAAELFCCEFREGLYQTGIGNEHWHLQSKDGLGWVRIWIFLVCRGAAFLLLWRWQTFAEVDSRIWRHARETQFNLHASVVLLLVLIVVSYEAIAQVQVNENIKSSMDRQSIENAMMGHRRAASVFSLNLFPVYIVVASWHQFRFCHTLVFWLIPLLLECWGWKWLCGEHCEYCNLYFSDSSRWILILTNLIHSYGAWLAERNSRGRFLAGRSVELTRQRIDAIVETLMPPMVVEEIRGMPLSAPPPSHKFQKATIAQSDLCGFTKLASNLQPYEVVKFMGELFGFFDELTDKHQVYKVETVGDAYIAGQADFPLTRKNLPASVVLFGLEMVRAVHEWSRKQGWSVSCRVGIAHGACIGGIVGTEMQRYHLFGELMSCLEVLESTAPEGAVQVSSACKGVVEQQMRKEGIPGQLISFEQREEPHLTTSKGDVIELEQVGGATFIVRSDSTFRGWLGA